MKREAASVIMPTLVLIGLLTLVFNIQQVSASGTIYIRADGSVNPPTAPISSVDNVTYTFTADIYDSIVVERDDIVVDGADYTVQGTGTGIGISLSFRSNVEVKDFKVIGFTIGIKLENSNNCTVFGNIVAENGQYGIYLSSSSYNQIFWNKATDNGYYGIYLESSDNNLIDGNVATNNERTGIRLDFSSNSNVSFNTAKNNGLRANLTSNWAGIWLAMSPNSTVSDNTVVNNNRGIGLGLSGNSVVSGNVMSGNNYNFDVNGASRSDFDITIDPGNIADGKPILYMINSSNTVFDSSDKAATIYIIDSVNVTIRDITLTNNVKGVFFWNTNNSRIENVMITDNSYGVRLRYSNNITISGNTIANNGIGARPWYDCDNITFSGNTIANNALAGIFLLSSNNILSGNTIANNGKHGVYLASGSNNAIFHNNIINNQVADLLANTWDDGATGNYWSDYNGNDTNLDGIGDTPYIIDENSQDNYPLMEPWSQTRIFNVTWDEETYKVGTLSNSTIASLTFNQTDKQISFKATGPNGTTGFCNVTIPKELLDAPSDQWTITVNGETVNPSVTENATHTFIYFTFTHSTQTVNIKGTNPIDNTQPVANAGQNQTANEDIIVTFDGSASTDNVGIASYIWTFTDETPQTLTDVSQTYTFRTPGTYTITLNVTDIRGNSDTDTVTIVILDTTASAADAGRDQTIEEDMLVTFDGSRSTDNVDPTGYTWTFIDVTPQTLTGKNPTYTFQTPSTYIVTLNVTDAAGNWDNDTVTITVLDVTAPTADAGLDQTVDEKVPISFNASASSDNVNIAIEGYTWTFIDQTPQTLGGPTPSYRFTTPGTYNVTLNITDAAGNWDTDTMTVTVRAAPVWTQSWFWAMIFFVPTISGVSYLIFRYGRKEGIYEQLQKLVRQYVRNTITKEDFEEKLRKLEERSDPDTRARIKEYLPPIKTLELAIVYIDEQKKR